MQSYRLDHTKLRVTTTTTEIHSNTQRRYIQRYTGNEPVQLLNWNQYNDEMKNWWNEDPNNPNNNQPLKGLHFVLGDGVEKVTFGGSRDLRVDGNELDNVIIGNDGNNIINGKSGNDVILGGDGDDIINGGKGDDFIDGQVGMDKVYGHRANDTLVATGSDNGTTDSNQNDFLSGGSGDDTIIDLLIKLMVKY